MAKIKPGPMISQASGKQGGTVFSHNRYGMYTRNWRAPVQPRSPRQVAQRAAFSNVSNYWNKTMTDTDRAAWEEYASQTPLTDSLGERQQVAGNAMFLRHAAVWFRHQAAVLTAAPTTPGEAVTPLATLSGTVAVGVSVTAWKPAPAATDYILVSRAVSPCTQAKNFYGGPFYEAQWELGSQAPPLVIIGPTEMAIGQRWFLTFRVFAADGRVGPQVRLHVDINA